MIVLIVQSAKESVSSSLGDHAKDSRQKLQGFAAKAIVKCWLGDHRKRLTTEAASVTLLCHAIALYRVTCVSQSCA